MNLQDIVEPIESMAKKDLRVLTEAIKYIETVSFHARIYARAVSERAHQDVPDPQRVLAGLKQMRSRLMEGSAKVAKRS